MPSCRSTWGCQEPGVDCTKESIEQGWFLWQYLKISLLAYRSLPFITFVSELVLVFVSQLQIILDEKINYVDKISKTYIQQVLFVWVLLIFDCTKHVCSVKFYFLGITEKNIILKICINLF